MTDTKLTKYAGAAVGGGGIAIGMFALFHSYSKTSELNGDVRSILENMSKVSDAIEENSSAVHKNDKRIDNADEGLTEIREKVSQVEKRLASLEKILTDIVAMVGIETPPSRPADRPTSAYNGQQGAYSSYPS